MNERMNEKNNNSLRGAIPRRTMRPLRSRRKLFELKRYNPHYSNIVDVHGARSSRSPPLHTV